MVVLGNLYVHFSRQYKTNCETPLTTRNMTKSLQPISSHPIKVVEEERGTNDGREKPISAVGPDSQRRRREEEWKKCYTKLKKRRNARIAKTIW